MRRPRLHRDPERNLTADVTNTVGRGLEDVGRRLEGLTGDVEGLRREIVTGLPAEAVTALAKGSVRFLRAAAVTVIFGGIIIGLTTQLRPDSPFGFLAQHKVRLILGEIGLFGILSVELLVRSVPRYLRSRNAQSAAFVLRVVIRTASYAILTVSIVSMLASSPALAIGVGSVTGLIIGLSAQATVGNAVAGTVIAIARPFRIGDEITIMGITGRVVEIAVMHTILENRERRILVPSTTLMTQIIQRTKPASEIAAAESGAGNAAPASGAGAAAASAASAAAVTAQAAQAQAMTAAQVASFAAEGAEQQTRRRAAEQQRRERDTVSRPPDAPNAKST